MNAAVEKLPEKKVATWVGQMIKAQSRFEELAAIHGEVNWKAEASFAKQAFQKNTLLQQCTPDSILNAVINVGAIGLSLSPAEKYAYLVPRGRKINDVLVQECHLDIGYQGLIKLATDTGNCDYVRADIVRESDVFVYRGPAAAPEISIDPFCMDRGEIKGCYAIAKLASGDTLCEIMTQEEIAATEASSKARNGPWKGPFRSEMIKKSVLKRLCKTIPRTDNSGRLHEAIHIVNEHEGVEIESAPPEPTYTVDQKNAFDKAIKDNDAAAIWHMSRTLDVGVYSDLNGSFPKGQKTKMKSVLAELSKQGHAEFEAAAIELDGMMGSDDELGAAQIIEEYSHQLSTLDEQIALISDELVSWTATLGAPSLNE